MGVVCLRWCIEKGAVAVTTTRREERMREYLSVFDFKLSEDEVKEISDAGVASLPDGKELFPRQIQ